MLAGFLAMCVGVECELQLRFHIAYVALGQVQHSAVSQRVAQCVFVHFNCAKCHST